ncbi:acyltransferase family protein [Lactobacillus amylovorus]|uniref:acyltransferase family protein n=1 Tax=Lactobacillus amylovorus TaxID=1604 RepID=UPI00313BC846|nr:acyltransferase family protein [Lactobacillus amylovorus]
MKKIRDSRFELLRIVAMLLIVASHFSAQSVIYWSHSNTLLETIKLMYFDILGQPGAIVFFIISGYFAFQSDDFSKQKEKAKNQVKKTWSKTWFYSVSILVLVWLIFGRPGLKQIAMAVLPFSFNEYWSPIVKLN